MDRKNIAFATIALLIVGAILFKDTLSNLWSDRDGVGSPRASLQRMNAPSSPLTKVLAAFDSDSFNEIIPKTSQEDNAQEEQVAKGTISQTWREPTFESIRNIDRKKETSSPGPGNGFVKSDLFITVNNVQTRKNNPSIRVKCVVQGSNIERIDIYRNGIYLFDIFNGKSKKGSMPVSFQYNDGTGIWIFRVVSFNGDYFERRFRFMGYTGGPVNSLPYFTRRFSIPSSSDWIAF
ncbi:MAG: hypothetical protein SGJ02_05490 [bacterium]|nr:hypothetical protein [bacterium]